MSFKERLNNAIKAFKKELDIVAMTLETADGKTLELEKESGEPVVGDVVISEDGEYLMPDGAVIVVEDSVITEIRSAEVVVEEPDAERGEETQEELEQDATDSEKDAEIDRLKAVIAEKDAEIDRLKEQLEAAQAQAKSDEEVEMLGMVETAGGIEWLKNVKSQGKAPKRVTESKSIEKLDKKTSGKSFAEYMNEKRTKK